MKKSIKGEQSKLVCYDKRENFRLKGKRIVTIVALICAVAFQVNAQNTVEENMKAAEAAVKLADENPEDCRKQYVAADALAMIAAATKDSSKFEQALTYAHKALEIALAHKERKDTLLANSYTILGNIYMAQGSVDNACKYMELSVDAAEELLGRYDAMTIYQRLMIGLRIGMIYNDARRGFMHVMQAFYDNDKAPADKRIKNMDVLDINFSIAMEGMMAAYANSNRHALLVVMIDGKSHYVMQTRDWHIGQPLMNWLTPQILRSEEERQAHYGENIILMNEAGEFRRLTKKEGQKLRMVTEPSTLNLKSRELEFKTLGSHIVYFPPETYNEILERFNKFINKK